MKRNSNHRNVLLLGLALLGGCRAVLDLDGYAFDGASTSATGSGGSAGTSTSTGSGGTGGTSMATGGPATTSASGGVGGAGGGPGVDCGTLTLCEGECADTANNPNHCGECGKTCPEGQLCQAGACTLNCAGGTTKCSGPESRPLCADTANNPNHCGECGKTCPEGQLCQAGACTLNCAGGTTKCSGPDMLPLCADTKLDPGHCGGCGNICASANAVGACTNSTCTFTCKPNFGDCNQLADDGCEAFTALDPANCGTCGLMCKAGESCVSSQCEDSTTTRITGGERHSCALLLDGTVKCWGDNAAGKLGLGDTSPRGDGPGEMGDSLPIVDLGVGPSIASVASKRGHTCVLRVDGS
ncbi:MAG: hypothetical protein FJ096_20495, partial [Deltaproteobacteria bacterium]|nr:hypothetical protein [Deltaproteobacteria bacterium]